MMTLFEIANIVTALCIVVLGISIAYHSIKRIRSRKNMPRAIRNMYISKGAVGILWAVLFASVVFFDNYAFGPKIGALFVRPGLIATLTIILIGHLMCRE